jgi:tetratricopeptide (TPR) repeat protein
MKALAPDPSLRYQSASTLGLELAAFRAGGKVAAVEEDLEATRRTFRRPEADDETRRTAGEETRRTVEPAPAAAGAAAMPEAAKKLATKPKSNLFYWFNRGVAAAVLASVVFATWAGVSDYRLYQNGQAFQRDVTSEQLTDPSQIWTRWAELSKNHPSSVFLRGPRKVARERFIAAADHTIDRYRNNDGQPVYENEWQRAHTMLLHALSTDPDDKTLHGELRLCEGQVSRIEGTAHSDMAQLNDAIQEFQEAQRSMPQSPDPPLGLARVYLSLKPADIEKAATAFQQAETNGYHMGGREESQLADAYRDRANRAWRDSFSVRGLPQEKEQIQRAAEDYQRALDLYQKSAGWANAALRIAEMQASLESANTRLQQIAAGQDGPESAVARHNKVAGAIIGLINALRNKSTKKEEQ